ncbi:MAG TPA: hypothetical protein EYQ81_09955 [Sneathiellales bacterium]|nr:hypothetical protein [Sneathiellales bacterium]
MKIFSQWKPEDMSNRPIYLRRIRLFFALSLVFTLLIPGGNSFAAEEETEIGVTWGTQRTPVGQPPVSVRRQLIVGTNVVHQEQITTNEADIAQLLFLDGSAITVGPNSNMILDEFVYDPDVGTGKIIVRATKGVFRFVGGKISKNGEVEFQSSSGTIGIRGGIAIIEVSSDSISGDFLFGDSMSMTLLGDTEITKKAGTNITASTAGGLSDPQPVNEASLGIKSSQFEGSAGTASSGAAAPESDRRGRSDRRQRNSINANASALSDNYSDSQVTGETDTGDSTGNPDSMTAETGEMVENEVQDASQEITTKEIDENTLGGAPVVATLDGAALRSGTTPNASGANINSTNAAFVARQFTRADVKSLDHATREGKLSVTAPIGPYVLYFPANNLACPADLTCTVGHDINQAAVTIQFPGSAGNEGRVITFDANREFFNYLITLADGSRELVLAGTPYVGQIPAGGVQTYNLVPDPFLESDIPFLRTSDTGFQSSNQARPAHIFWGSANTTSKPFLSSTIVIDSASKSLALSTHIGRVSLAASGGVTSAQSIAGEFIGIVDPTAGLPSVKLGEFDSVGTNGTVAGGLNDFFGAAAPNYFVLGIDPTPDSNPSPGPGIFTFASGLGEGTDPYFPVNIATPVKASLAPVRSLTGLSATSLSAFATGLGRFSNGQIPAQLGSIYSAGSQSGTSTITLDPVADTVTVTLNLKDFIGNGDVISASTTADSISAFIDDNDFAATLKTASVNSIATTKGEGYLITGSNTIVNGESFDLCTCAFMSWGFWGVAMKNEVAVGAAIEEFSAGLGNWVAGQLTPVGTFPQSGVISYAGDIIGNVSNAGEFYVATATGGVSMDVTFVQGGYDVTNFDFSFDGTNVTGLNSATRPASATNYLVSALDGGRQLTASGTFFGPNAENTGGQFTVLDSAANYAAVGVYAGVDTSLPSP